MDSVYYDPSIRIIRYINGLEGEESVLYTRGKTEAVQLSQKVR